MRKEIWMMLFVCIPIQLFAQQKATRTKQPNIIYIYADDMGIGELGCYGQQKIKTPHLDQLAAEGMRFTQHYSGTAVCAPSRCMLLTGKHAGHSYIRGNYELGGFADSTEGGQMPLPEGTFTIGHLMQKAGYYTGAIGKWGLGMSYNTGNPNKQGFNYFYGYLDQKQAHNFYPTHLWENGRWDSLQNNYVFVHTPLQPNEQGPEAYSKFTGKEYSIDKMVEKTKAFIQQHQHEPFFLYLPYTGPHVSLQAPPEAVKAYLGQFDEKPYRGEKGYASTMYPLSTYAAMITYFDAQVGVIMQLLKDLKLDDHTIVLFSSDNGATFNTGGANTDFFNSTAGLRGRKMDLYEGGIRAPFIARWPGKIPAGKVSNQISTQYDMLATFAAITKQKLANTDGINILPTLLGQTQQQQHPYLYFEYPEKGGQIAVRIGRYKGVRSGLKKDKNAAWEIYDLQNDPYEKHDIAVNHQDLVPQLNAIVEKAHMPPHLVEWEFLHPKNL
ncbi:arylsulfatase A-like enzyme [Chitinophaga skermanii]|uniref:Arylsulfatase A-like enzyme n=1 Tax=Chitinophaga skermanii TaxID=331697 RepID=A0A327QCE7_9BACT|nr:arylsulfatase [Chitinophaga skermanii]RAJ02229.1 arylsulfatase A-like enzyme [Chitinophaga skermanii]